MFQLICLFKKKEKNEELSDLATKSGRDANAGITLE